MADRDNDELNPPSPQQGVGRLMITRGGLTSHSAKPFQCLYTNLSLISDSN